MSCETNGYFVRVRVEQTLCPRVTATGAVEYALSKQQALALRDNINRALEREDESPST